MKRTFDPDQPDDETESDSTEVAPSEKPAAGSYDPVKNHPSGTYAGLYSAFHFFNYELFRGNLPDCLITMQRHNGAFGYFSGGRFANTSDQADIRDEIAMNPQHFASRSNRDTLATLAHEMAHLAQHHFGQPGRGGYHNAEFANLMDAIGLVTSSTGQPGGARTGDRMSHYIREDGPFDRACAAFLQSNSTTLYQDLAYQGDAAARRRERTAASKTRFICGGCALEKAWAKSTARIKCGRCNADLRASA